MRDAMSEPLWPQPMRPIFILLLASAPVTCDGFTIVNAAAAAEVAKNLRLLIEFELFEGLSGFIFVPVLYYVKGLLFCISRILLCSEGLSVRIRYCINLKTVRKSFHSEARRSGPVMISAASARLAFT